jgi:hypothetical protein
MNDTKEDIPRMIVDYLRKNPGAGDTLAGISNWWLECERVNQSVDKISQILEAMIKRGSLKKIKKNNTSYIYKIME